jgi:hypothetical protein
MFHPSRAAGASQSQPRSGQVLSWRESRSIKSSGSNAMTSVPKPSRSHLRKPKSANAGFQAEGATSNSANRWDFSRHK